MDAESLCRADEAKSVITDLVKMVKQNRVTESTPRERWPSYIRRNTEDQSAIGAWAAAAAISTIAVSEDLHALLVFDSPSPSRPCQRLYSPEHVSSRVIEID